jgi:hypothetical protein
MTAKMIFGEAPDMVVTRTMIDQAIHEMSPYIDTAWSRHYYYVAYGAHVLEADEYDHSLAVVIGEARAQTEQEERVYFFPQTVNEYYDELVHFILE